MNLYQWGNNYLVWWKGLFDLKVDLSEKARACIDWNTDSEFVSCRVDLECMSCASVGWLVGWLVHSMLQPVVNFKSELMRACVISKVIQLNDSCMWLSASFICSVLVGSARRGRGRYFKTTTVSSSRHVSQL